MARIADRNKGKGCGACAGQKVDFDNSLAIVNPNLSAEWHPTENGKLTPKDVRPGTRRKVWWVCPKNSDHDYQATINNRSNGRNCPYCSGKKVNITNCLATLNPGLTKEWDYKKNAILTPYNLTVSSGKKVWWECKYNHSWEAVVASRHTGRGCPKCRKDSSFMEVGIYSEIKYFFDDAIHKIKLFGMELDIFIPSLQIGIEYDGVYWHKDKEKRDLKKNKALEKHNIKIIKIIRIRENGLPVLSENDLILLKNYTYPTFNVISTIVSHIIKSTSNNNSVNIKLKNYISLGKLQNEGTFNELSQKLCGPFDGKSMSEVNAELTKEWHPTKNGLLTPSDVSPGSGRKVWWLCSKGHEWEAVIGTRSKDAGCPFCSGRMASKKNNLAVINPQLALEWHPTKNGSLSPDKVTVNSGQKVWWICPLNPSHEWEARVVNRNHGNKCPFCLGRKVNIENCLATIKPTIAKEWHPNKNGTLTPYDIRPSSNLKVWWLCEKGHEWEAWVYNRKAGRGCLVCFKTRLS